jgi:hypothetical protein
LLPVAVVVITLTLVERTTGQVKFSEFLEKNGISFAAAGRALLTGHVTVRNWVLGLSNPEQPFRHAIEVWTGGEVLEADWMTAKERDRVEQLADIQPFVAPTQEPAA